MKKIKTVSLLLICLIFLCSCSEYSSVTSQTQSEVVTDEYTSALIEETSVENESSIEFTKENYQGISNNASKENKVIKPVEENTPLTTGNNTVTDNEKKTITVTISVDCINAINYGILSVGTFSQALPSDGMIVSSRQVTAKEGDSALKLLKSVLKDNKISYSITSGGYVKAINGLSEFDCGETSGWIYKINGAFPSVSMKSQTLSEGDVFEVRYTCVMGDS